MIEDKKNTVTLDNGEYWSPTIELRLVKKYDYDKIYKDLILQQKQISNLGNIKWVDIPIVKEFI